MGLGRWLAARLSGVWPLVLALLAGLALAFGLRRSGERAGRRMAEAEQARREKNNARAQARAAARYRRDGAAERLLRGKF